MLIPTVNNNVCDHDRRSFPLFPELSENVGMGRTRQNPRRKSVTEEHVQESDRLREIFQAKAGMSQERFGRLYGIGGQAAVSAYLNALTPLNGDAAARFAKGLSCSVADFSPRVAEMIRTMADATNVEFPDPSDMTLHEKQLLEHYRKLPPELQHYLLADANKYVNIANPERSEANPYPAPAAKTK